MAPDCEVLSIKPLASRGTTASVQSISAVHPYRNVHKNRIILITSEEILENMFSDILRFFSRVDCCTLHRADVKEGFNGDVSSTISGLTRSVDYISHVSYR